CAAGKQECGFPPGTHDLPVKDNKVKLTCTGVRGSRCVVEIIALGTDQTGVAARRGRTPRQPLQPGDVLAKGSRKIRRKGRVVFTMRLSPSTHVALVARDGRLPVEIQATVTEPSGRVRTASTQVMLLLRHLRANR